MLIYNFNGSHGDKRRSGCSYYFSSNQNVSIDNEDITQVYAVIRFTDLTTSTLRKQTKILCFRS